MRPAHSRRDPALQIACNMKMPGIYLAYAAIMFVFGRRRQAFIWIYRDSSGHAGRVVLIARKIFDLHGAAIATSAYALMTLSPAYFGLAAHATHFVMLPALLGIWMLFRVERNGRLLDCLGGGCLFGIAFLMKQPGIFFVFSADSTWLGSVLPGKSRGGGCWRGWAFIRSDACCLFSRSALAENRRRVPANSGSGPFPTRANMQRCFHSMKVLRTRSTFSR